VPGAQAAFGVPAIKRRYPQPQRYGVRTARASGTSTRRTTAPRLDIRAILLLWVSHVCPALLRCCAASVLAWPTTSGQRNNVSRGHGQAQCHGQDPGVVINVSQTSSPATTGKPISGQPANAPAQPSSSTSPSLAILASAFSSPITTNHHSGMAGSHKQPLHHHQPLSVSALAW
jgi:hypothetical protein